jgi:hypothetical protein
VPASDTIFCPNCGERISARSRFCSSCGARQDEYRVEPDESPSGLWAAGEAEAIEAPPAEDEPEPASAPAREPLTDRIGRVDPQAGELTALLRERLALPGIVAAAIAGVVSAAIVLAAGLLIALVTPDTLIVGWLGLGTGVVREAFRQAVGTLLTAMVDVSPESIFAGRRRIHPLLVLAIPLTAIALSTRWQMRRTEGAAPMARIGWALLVAVPFALLMLIFAVIGGESDVTRISASPGSAFGLGLLWGVVGALIGAVGKVGLGDLQARPAPSVRGLVAAVLATLRPLAAVLIVATALGLVGWLVQVARDAGDVRAGRSAATALIEETAFAGEHGVHLTALAAGARFTADENLAIGLPFPVEDYDAVPGRDGGFRIFAYDDQLPAYVLLPVMILLMGLLALAALYAGFAAARAARAGSLAAGTGWGAITGPAWGLAMVVLVVLAGGLFHGDADDTSVFGVFLLGGALLGAAGGALAVSDQSPADSS